MRPTLKPTTVNVIILLCVLVAYVLYLRDQVNLMAEKQMLEEAMLKIPAGTDICESIPDNNRKNLCLALALEQLSACDAITIPDSRHLCRAQVSDDRTACSAISNPDTRKQCQAMFPP